MVKAKRTVGLWKTIRSNKGFMSIYVLLVITAMLPFAFLVTVDLPYVMTMNRKIKNTVDNAAATAVTALNESALQNGILEINRAEAEVLAHNVIQQSFGFGEDYEVLETTLVETAPVVTVQVVNESDIQADSTYETANGTFEITNPSVIVTVDFPVKALIFPGFEPVIQHTGISEVSFHN